MSVNEYMVWFIGTAIAIITLLVLGTLAAADLLHRPGPTEESGDIQSSTRDHREGDLAETLAALGSSLGAGSGLHGPKVREHEG